MAKIGEGGYDRGYSKKIRIFVETEFFDAKKEFIIFETCKKKVLQTIRAEIKKSYSDEILFFLKLDGNVFLRDIKEFCLNVFFLFFIWKSFFMGYFA